MTPNEVFEKLMDVMWADNGFRFHYTEKQKQEAYGPISELQAAGYFADDPYDLAGSFWMAGAPEYDDAPAYFSKAPEAYENLSNVLNSIFNEED